MAIARLCWKLFHEENHYPAVEKHRRKLEWIVKRVDVMEPDVEGLPDDMDFISVLAGQLAFTKQYGKLGDASTVYKFVHDATDDKDLILLNNQKDAIRESISRLDELLGEAGLKKAQNADIEVAISAAFKNARKRLHTFIAKQYLLTLSQSPSRSNDKRQDVPFGIDGAVALVRKLWALDYHEEEGFSGPINTAMDQIAQHLDEIFEADENDRIRFSLEHLDNAFLIGRKFNKFIGILGFTNRGKSLLLRSIAFNAAMQGKKVLFVGLEGGDALNTKTQFGLLLGSIYEMQKTCPLPNHENCTFKMPSYENFKHKRITQEDKDHMALVLRQLDNHEVLPGVIEVCDRKTLNDWDSIAELVEREKYDMACVDYMDILNTPGVKSKDREFAVEALYQQASDLCGKLGCVVVTPLQVNRAGEAQAAGKDPYEERIYDLTHISKRSIAYQAMDIVLAVYSSDEMKRKGEMKIEVLKVREGDYPEDFFCNVDKETTLYVSELPGLAGRQGKKFLQTLNMDATKPAGEQKMGDADATERDEYVDEALA